MPTTILHGESLEQAKQRRFAEEAEIDKQIEEKMRVADNIHPIFAAAIAPLTPPAMRPFAVRIFNGDMSEEINIMGFTSCDAIAKAIDLFFDGEGPMPIGSIAITARPIHSLKSVA